MTDPLTGRRHHTGPRHARTSVPGPRPRRGFFINTGQSRKRFLLTIFLSFLLSSLLYCKTTAYDTYTNHVSIDSSCSARLPVKGRLSVAKFQGSQKLQVHFRLHREGPAPPAPPCVLVQGSPVLICAIKITSNVCWMWYKTSTLTYNCSFQMHEFSKTAL